MPRKKKLEKFGPKDVSPERPVDIRALLDHPILKVDNDPTPCTECYEDWALDHANEARFYLKGFNTLRRLTREPDAKYYYKYADVAVEIAEDEGWNTQINGDWKSAPSYNQFRNAFISQSPMYFHLAALVFLTCERALQSAIDQGKYKGHCLDVYKIMSILPGCYNIDEYNKDLLKQLRRDRIDYDEIVLRNTSQRDIRLLDDLASGKCVTRDLARAIRKETIEVAKVKLGDVRGKPGSKKLGRQGASRRESVNLEGAPVPNAASG